MKPRLLLLIALAAVAWTAAPSRAAIAARHDRLPLHARSAGPNVSKLQYLIREPRPRQNVFTQIRGTFKGHATGVFDTRTSRRTSRAVITYKWRLGYPRKGECGAPVNLVIPTAGQHLFDLLQGRRARPACWVALAASRLKAINPGPTAMAVKIRMLEQSWLGIVENPDGSNRGPCVSTSCTWRGRYLPALQSSTRAYGLAWCVSTQQTAFLLSGAGTFAGDTAGVYSAVDYYAARRLVSAKAKIGALVAFIDYDRHGRRIPGTGHMGFVAAVQASSFTYMAGNDGNAFREHTIAMGSRSYLFIYKPGVA